MLSGVAEPLLDGFAATGTSLLYSDTAARACGPSVAVTLVSGRDPNA
jgi:hypothetical protein